MQHLSIPPPADTLKTDANRNEKRLEFRGMGGIIGPKSGREGEKVR